MKIQGPGKPPSLPDASEGAARPGAPRSGRAFEVGAAGPATPASIAGAPAARSPLAAPSVRAPRDALTRTVDALASEVRAGRLSPAAARVRLVDETLSHMAPGLPAVKRADLRAALERTLAEDPTLKARLVRLGLAPAVSSTSATKEES